MPVLSQAISEQTHHIFMPVITQVSHRILDMFAYRDVIGQNIYINTDWSTHSQTSDQHHNAIIGQQQLKVDAQIQLNPTSQKFDAYTFHHTAAYGIGHPLLNNTFPIYLDTKNRVRIVELVSPVTIVLNCELILQSAELAYKTPIQIFNGHENGSVHNFVDLFFDYPVPKPILSVLFGLWKMDRCKGEPAGVPFIKYLALNTENTWQTHKHREKEQYEVVVPRANLKALSVLEYSDDRPNANIEDRLPVSFTIPFMFTFQFGMPTNNILTYPVVYNNQLVPHQFIPVDRTIRMNYIQEQHHGIADNDYHAYHNNSTRDLKPYVQFPFYDEWVLPSKAPIRGFSHMPTLIASVLVDEEHPKLLTKINLDTDFHGQKVELTPLTKEILYQEGQEAVSYDCIYSVSVFRDDTQLLPYKDYRFNEDLVISFKARDLSAHYRVVVSAIMDLSKLNPKWYGLLFKYFKIIPRYMKDYIRKRFTKPGATLDDEGNFRNFMGDIVGSLKDLPEVKQDAYYSATRIVRNTIIAREINKP